MLAASVVLHLLYHTGVNGPHNLAISVNYYFFSLHPVNAWTMYVRYASQKMLCICGNHFCHCYKQSSGRYNAALEDP